MAVVYRFSNFCQCLATSRSCWVYGIDYLAVFQTVLPQPLQIPQPLTTGTRP